MTTALSEFIRDVIVMCANLAKHTGGGRGIRRIGISPAAGAEMGLAPGERLKIATVGGQVEVFCETGES